MIDEGRQHNSREQRVHENYFTYGWDEYVTDSLRENPQGFEVTSWLEYYDPVHWDVPKPFAEQAFTNGWNAAKEQAAQGIIPFLLEVLLRRMNAGEEWYGTSFDEPMQIVKKDPRNVPG